MRIEVICRHHNDLVVDHFGIDKTRELVTQKYYLSSFQYNVKAYIKACDIHLAANAIKHKSNDDL